MSRFTRKKGKKKRKQRGENQAPEPVLTQPYDLLQSVCERWDGPRITFRHDPLAGMRKLDREHLEEVLPYCLAWRYHPGTFHLGGGNVAKPTFLFLKRTGEIHLRFVATKVTDDLVVSAAMLQKIHPWFKVMAGDTEGPVRLPETFEPLKPRKPTGDITKSMSTHEREHVDHLEDWRKQGKIRGWLYEPVAWQLGYLCQYSPDFLVFGDDWILWQEVKGHMVKDDAKVKLKMFANLYPWWGVEVARRFRQKGEGHETWEIKRVKPGDPHGFSRV